MNGGDGDDGDAVRRRVMRQLVESLVYEGRLPPAGVQGQGVAYRWTADRRFSFDRPRLGAGGVQRCHPDGRAEEELSPVGFLAEVGEALGAERERLAGFAEELDRTVANDIAARRHWRSVDAPDLEAAVIDGHPYHPSYKSRLGFTDADNAEFGPEFARALRPVRVATEVKGRPVVIPVHPWQWRRHAATTWVPLRLERLPDGADGYRAQQSIRTLANTSRPERPSLKLALSIVNTSTARTLAPHTVANAPLITAWLERLVAGDGYLGRELRPILLGERRGVARSPELAAIWRDSPLPSLTAGEEAAPFTALTHVDRTGSPFIAPWVKEPGVEAWTRRLLEVTLPPVLHLLVAHGVALEAHAQNLLLVHRAGRPERLGLRDFHDGLRYSVAGLADATARPALRATPPEHLAVNRNSYLEAEDETEVRDFALDCLLFVNLAELAMFLEDRFDLAEQRFWAMARRVVEDHRRRFPELAGRAARFDVLAPRIAVEQLTTRRLLPDTEVRTHAVRNPLALVDAD